MAKTWSDFPSLGGAHGGFERGVPGLCGAWRWWRGGMEGWEVGYPATFHTPQGRDGGGEPSHQDVVMSAAVMADGAQGKWGNSTQRSSADRYYKLAES
jgi:hypothetical protein